MVKNKNRLLLLLISSLVISNATGCSLTRPYSDKASELSKDSNVTAAEEASKEAEQLPDGSDTQQAEETDTNEIYGSYTDERYDSSNPDPLAPVIDGLEYDSTVQLDFAECFNIFRYKDGYSVIRVDDGRDYIIIPEEKAIPIDIPSSCIVLKRPLKNMYLAATATMSFFDSLNALDNIRLVGTKQEGWYIDNAVEAMKDGKMIYAGKYSEPDYEMLLAEGTSVAIESSMILHVPEVEEKLESLGIPVFVDRSSYEYHPMGRTEWMKVYAELTDTQEECHSAFGKQKEYLENLKDFENTEKTVAFFYVNSNGVIVTRKTSDYLPKMIELAGGKYAFENLGEDGMATSSIEMTMEEFYASAKDVDYLIYNATIDSPISSVEELIMKNELFADFKAVKNDNVWCTGKYLYQGTNSLGEMIENINEMLVDESAQELSFMTRLH